MIIHPPFLRRIALFVSELGLQGRMADYCGGAHRGSCVSRAIGWQNAGTGTADCSTWTTTRLLPRVLGQADCHLGACRLSGYPSGQNCIFNPVGAPYNGFAIVLLRFSDPKAPLLSPCRAVWFV